MEPSKISIEELEKLLNYWEHTIDGVKWSEEDRDLCIEVVTESKQLFEWWMNDLIKVPKDINDRYRNMLSKLLENKMITPESYDAEVSMMEQLTPAMMTRNGKRYAEWYRQEEAIGFPCPVY